MKALVIIGILAGVVLIAWLVTRGFNTLSARRKEMDRRQHATRFASAAPDRVENSLSQPFIRQRELLQDADNVIARVLGDEMNVFMPGDHRAALLKWRDEYSLTIARREV